MYKSTTIQYTIGQISDKSFAAKCRSPKTMAMTMQTTNKTMMTTKHIQQAIMQRDPRPPNIGKGDIISSGP